MFLSASLYLPLLELVRVIFKANKHLAMGLIEVAPNDLVQVLIQISVHLKLAHESLAHTENVDVLYTPSEASTIVELTANFIKSIIDSKTDVVTFIALQNPASIVVRLSFIHENLPRILFWFQEWISNCSTLMKSKTVARVAMILVAEEERLREIELRTAAALIIQAFWRKIIQQRKYRKMRRGFIKLQAIAKRKLRTRENKLLEQFKASEKEFEMQLQAVKERRRKQELRFESIKNTPSHKLNVLFQLKQSASSVGTAKREAPTEDVESTDDEESKAAKTIQNAVRRWLHKRLHDNLARSQPFLNLPITEERAIKLQQEIDHWQYHHPSIMSTPNELGELHNKAQMSYAKFCQGLLKSRRQEQKTMALIAQSKNIIDILETRPTLNEYDSCKDWAKFHSLPLHIATMARIEHKRAMSKLESKHWQRILQSDDA